MKPWLPMLMSLWAVSSTPPLELVDDGACPSECCRYGEWTTIRAVKVFARPASDSPVIATIAAQTPVKTLTGRVLTRRGEFVVKKRYGQYSPGDILFVYTYLGEGFFKVWFRERWYEEDLLFSPYGGTAGTRCTDGDECWGELRRKHASTWWVKLALQNGKTGWARNDRSFTSKEACG
jgi:hypothetical protein